MRFLKLWRWWILTVLAVGVLLLAAERALETPTVISYYRVTASNALVVGVTAGPWTWMTRVSEVEDASSSVTIWVRTSHVPLPQTAEGHPIELTVTLHDPLGNRAVVDGADGNLVVQTRCLPPVFRAPGCVVGASAR